MTLPHLSIADQTLQKVVEGSTGAPISGDNKVEILLNGDETWPVLVKELRAAKKTITFEVFIFRKGDIGDQIVSALEDRCRAGVHATILLDAHGSEGFPDDYTVRLTQAGCELIAEFRPKHFWNWGKINKRNHRRVVVVDGRVGITGGFGVDEAWSGDGKTEGHWRETNVRLEGPVVQQLQEAFIEHWKEATGVVLGGDEYQAFPTVTIDDSPVLAQIIRSSPTRDNYVLYEVLLQAIQSAQRSILISTPYLMPSEQMTAALQDAVRRGVLVRVLVPSIIRDAWIEYMVQETQREDFGTLLDAGIQISEYHPALLHAKVMTIDGEWSTVGSMNLDNRSMALNDELNVIFYDKVLAARVQEILEDDLSRARPITRKNLETRGWLGRLLGTIMTPFSSQL